MADLATLLQDRNKDYLRGSENLRGGNVWYFTHTDHYNGRCQFCWISPGDGTALVELWGASGSGARQCCCGHASGPAGNPGAYSRKLVRVCATSYVCGWVGCAQPADTLCYAGRSNCSVACIFQSGDNGTMIAQGGFGGYTRCSTSTPMYCCLRAAGFCGTLFGTACGIICNIGGPNGATLATASGGDCNISGGFSCVRYWCCHVNAWGCANEQDVSISPGIHSSRGPVCLRFGRNQAPINAGNGGTTGRAEANIALSGLAGVTPQFDMCWSGNRECGCYEVTGCMLGMVGMPGTSGTPCASVRAMGTRGGQGAVKITFYT